MSGAAPAVLLVEDDDDIREVLLILFDCQGIAAAAARDGIDALEQLRSGPIPAVILVDLMMPRLDGEGLIRAMRADPALASVPVVVMSGHGEGRARSVELDADGFLAKPVELDQVLALVRRLGAR